MDGFGRKGRRSSASDAPPSKRKLENAHTQRSLAGAINATRDGEPCRIVATESNKVRKRGSSVASMEGTPMKRSLSDGIITSRMQVIDCTLEPEELDEPRATSTSCSHAATSLPPEMAGLAPIDAHESFSTYARFAHFSCGRPSVPTIPEQSAMHHTFALEQTKVSPSTFARRASVPTSPNQPSPSDAVDLSFHDSTQRTSVIMPSAPKCSPHAKRGWQPSRRKRNPGNLSLDLSQMSSPRFDASSAQTGIRRNEQAAVCSRLTDFLFIGGAAAAKDRDNLMAQGITHIINCAATIAPSLFPDEFTYYNIQLRDHASQDIARYFYNVVDFIEKARRRGGRIFVHCVKGISRSPTIAMAYLMWYKSIDVYKALEFVRQARPAVDPNAGFIFQLTEWAQVREGGKLKLDHPIIFRIDMPSEESNNGNGNGRSNGNASRAQDQPLIIGPLSAMTESDFLCPNKEMAASCFVVSCGEYMFVWSGDAVHESQLEATYQAVALLQQYESFPETYELVARGHECTAFWSVLEMLHPQQNV